MYNSEEVYTFDENKQTQSHAPSTDEQKNARLNNSRPKNGLLLGHKTNGISGTYARIVPKKPLHDMERLYAENMQLREKIRFLQEDGTKIKTRLQMAQKQKQQLINQLCSSEYGNSVLKDRRPSQKGLVKTQDKISKLGIDENRRILHSYKDQISKLKLQNGRLKKTVKYTQIQQLQTENQLLHSQMVRMKKYMKDVIENTQYDEYERQIQKLNGQLQDEKDSKKSIYMQLKKKDEEMQQVKNKMKIIANRKTQLQKKYNREMSNVKGELYRAKERQKEYFVQTVDKKQTSKQKYAEKQADCKNCSSQRQIAEKEKKKLLDLQAKLVAKQKQVNMLQNKLREFQLKNSKVSQKSVKKQSPKNVKNSQVASNQQTKPVSKEPSQSTQKNLQNQNKQIQNHISKPKQDSHHNHKQQHQKNQQHKQQEDYYQQDSDLDEDEDEGEEYQNVDQSEDKVDVFHVNLNKDEKQPQKQAQKSKEKNQVKHQRNISESNDKYDQSYNQSKPSKKRLNQNDSQQQVLFQKQEKKKSKKQKQKAQKKNKDQQVPKQKQKVTGTKAEKILKQTIKYRLMAQRYTYKDFHRDIKDSGATDFTVQQLISMLTNQPFFLSQDHLKMVLFSLFDKQQLDESDVTTTGSFLKKMKALIGQFEIRDEQQEQALLKSIQIKLNKKKLLPKMKQQATNGNEISKKGFVKTLKQSGGLNEDQIEQCLAEASVISIDIAHINYVQFLQKLAHS